MLPPPLPGARQASLMQRAAARTRAAAALGPLNRVRPGLALKRAKPVLKTLLYALAPLALLAGIGAGVLHVRLRHGPISFDVLVPPIERGINAELVNNQVRIKGAELRLGDSGEFEFRLRDLSVLDLSGNVVAIAPLSAVNISKAALWRFRIVPERVVLIDPEINLTFSDETGLALSAAKLPADGEATAAPKGDKAPGSVAAQPAAEAAASSEALNLAKMLSQASARARRQLDATSYLTELGMENATVVLDYAGRRSSWRINEVGIDFNHARKRSVISGRASIASSRGEWALSFLTDESEKTDRIVVRTTIRDLVPSTLAAAAPPLALFGMFDMPVAGDATVELATSGDIVKAEMALQAGNGQIILPGVTADPFQLTAGLFRLAYDGRERTFELQPSPVKWSDGNIMFAGSAKDISGERGPPVWRYSLEGKNGTFDAEEFGVPPVTLDEWRVIGSIIPRRGVVEVGDFRVRGGGGEVAMKGITRAGPEGQSARAELTLSAMPLATLKAIWPRALAHGAREWVGERVTKADFRGGTVRFTSGEFLEGEAPVVGAIGERLTASFEVAEAAAVPLDGMVPVVAPHALIRLENNALEVVVPEAAATLPDGRTVPIKAGRLTSPDVIKRRPDGELAFSVEGNLGPFLEVLESMPLKPVREAGPLPKAAEGVVDAQFKIAMPLVAGLKIEEVGVEGKARITDGRFGKVVDQFDVQGFTLDLALTGNSLDAKGDLLVNGVPAKITGSRIFNVESDLQPPITINAKLDDTDRSQLGLDINDLVHGVVPVEISLAKGPGPEPVIKLKADLTGAELMIEPVAWAKAPGRSAALEADIVSGKTHKTELQNFKISGDDIAVEGWVGIGADSKMKEFYFPEFTLNVVSRLEVQGTRGKDAVWDIKAKGRNFDGRDFFRSLFAVDASPRSKSDKAASGVDLDAQIDNVLGASDLALKGFKLKLSSRAEKLTALDARGTLDSGEPLAAALDMSNGSRRLLADSSDAGQTLKLVGFYPNIEGGRLRLEINLDGKGAAEKTGILWVENFKVLGDPIVSEVVGSADQGRPAISGRKSVTREVFSFDRMRAPFSVGYGQFVLEDAYVRGPMLGANLTGKVDYKTRRINLGGTYIPLQGLNSALGGIPVLGQLISGTKGEGIFGITFAIQGDLAQPQVLVNPLSIVAPGIFRDLFQMTNPNQKVQVREERMPAAPVEKRVRASAPQAAPPVVVEEPQVKPRPPRATTSARESIDGWTSTTSP